MQRNWHVWRSLLIIAGLGAAVALPVLVSGSLDLEAARGLQGLNAHAAAAAKYESAAHRLPWRPELWEQAGREALLGGSPQEAIRSLERAGHLSSSGWLALGRAYLQTGQLDPALEAYDSALAGGGSAEIYAGLAEIHRQRGDLES